MPVKNQYISVIIPVYNDSINLRQCLKALHAQTLDKSRYEIIVVDNGSTDDIKSIIDEYAQAKFLDESKPGSYAARNKGLLNSVGDIIAFTDSDCIPDEDWLERGLKYISDKDKVGILAGKVNFFAMDKENMTAVELWEMLYNYNQQYLVEDMNFGLTANLFTKRDIINKVGVFNSSLKSAGDYEWGQRVHAEGYEICYDEKLIVKHPARRTLSQLNQKIRRLIGGKIDTGLMTRTDVYKKIAHDMVPPILGVYGFMRKDEYKSLNRLDYKIKLIYMFIYLRYLSVFELVRLLLGGKAER